jgi:hypothetical protein
MMQSKFWRLACLMLAVALALNLAASGCKAKEKIGDKVREITGSPKPDDEEESFPPEAREESVMIDGKTYVRSRNPYYLTYPTAPEYTYVEKGKEFIGFQDYMVRRLTKAMGREREKEAAKGVPQDKMQELVRQEVERILKEQGLGAFVSRTRGDKAPYVGRAVAVIPDLDTPRNLEGPNRSLATALAESLRRQKDINVSSEEQVRDALSKARLAGKASLTQNVKALGDQLGVQGLVLTGILPPEKGAAGVMVIEVYDAFLGTKVQSVAAPTEGAPKPESLAKFAQQNTLRVAGELINLDWFGRVEFIKDNKVYLSLGQNAGLKVGDRLKVVAPGKEVINPRTNQVLGYTADIPQGELKVMELLGNTGAVAQTVSGGPFKPNDKVKAR